LMTYTKNNIVVSKIGIRGTFHFLTFDQNFNPIWQKQYGDRQVRVLVGDLYSFEKNGENCYKTRGNKIDMYFYTDDPHNGYYRYEFNPVNKTFKEPVFLFEFSGGFTIFDRKFIETKNGILFVTDQLETNYIGSAYGRKYSQQLFHVNFK
ncbi:hypothetical protein ACFLSQ_12010, partial [Bacteroidota bacterium]